MFANIYLLPIDKPSTLHLNSHWKQLSFTRDRVNYEQNQALYITSDETIENGGWCLLNGRLVVRYCKPPIENTSYKKIIFTSDPDLKGVQAIPDDFLKWFVENPSCEEVEYTKNYNRGNGRMYYHRLTIPEEKPKTNLEALPFPKLVEELSNHFKNIPLIEKTKQVTLEEAAYNVYMSGLFSTEEAFKRGAIWQQERSYSGEEVLNLLLGCPMSNEKIIRIWFEQFKKK